MKYSTGILCVSLLLVSFYGHAETGISRSVFTSNVVDREPVSDLKKIPTENTRVFFFTEFQGLKGRTITHRWEYNGEVLAEISFKIAANRWRTWSSKNMLASWIGNWQVSVLDEGGNILEQASFEYFDLNAVSPSEKIP
ncbi:MAG TPA: DUF2914 domain-containing protein [Gammaproteobacteria bacterium]|nr:DUF2914 domain-containing protein [Gammaproteobacteria bacterium]